MEYGNFKFDKNKHLLKHVGRVVNDWHDKCCCGSHCTIHDCIYDCFLFWNDFSPLDS